MKEFEDYLYAELNYRKALKTYQKSCLALLQAIEEQAGPHPCDGCDPCFAVIGDSLIELLPRDNITEANASKAFMLHHAEIIKS